MSIKPIFMWAGGKTRMMKHYEKHLPENFDIYIEPFFGGGAMFIKAKERNPKADFIINDINTDIMNIYYSIKSDYDKFISKLNYWSKIYLSINKIDKEKRKKFYFNVRTIYAFDYLNMSLTEESATLYFLMKTGFNGIWQINHNTNERFGTPAGLLNQETKIYDKENLDKWHNLLQNVIILNQDYKSTLKYIDINKKTWIFCDPPYRGGFTKYGTGFDDNEQKKVLEFMITANTLGTEVWLCNRDLGDGFYSQYSPYIFNITYTAGRRKQVNKKDSYTGTGFEAKKAKEILIIKGKL